VPYPRRGNSYDPDDLPNLITDEPYAGALDPLMFNWQCTQRLPVVTSDCGFSLAVSSQSARATVCAPANQTITSSFRMTVTMGGKTTYTDVIVRSDPSFPTNHVAVDDTPNQPSPTVKPTASPTGTENTNSGGETNSIEGMPMSSRTAIRNLGLYAGGLLLFGALTLLYVYYSNRNKAILFRDDEGPARRPRGLLSDTSSISDSASSASEPLGLSADSVHSERLDGSNHMVYNDTTGRFEYNNQFYDFNEEGDSPGPSTGFRRAERVRAANEPPERTPEASNNLGFDSPMQSPTQSPMQSPLRPSYINLGPVMTIGPDFATQSYIRKRTSPLNRLAGPRKSASGRSLPKIETIQEDPDYLEHKSSE